MYSPTTNRGVNSCLNTLSVEPKFASTKLLSAGGVLALTVLSALLLIAFQPAYAQTEKVLYSFGSYSGDGQNPGYAPLIYKGNFYGTTQNGGANSYGTVFKVTASGKESLLYSFCSQSNCTDGGNPSSGVISDKEGNLYGTTLNGGGGNWGTVFKVTLTGEESVFYSFGAYSGDGAWPVGGVIVDKEGNLYGTTSLGGANDAGTVYKITSSGEESVLYSFGSHSEDGNGPQAGLITDRESNLYGTTSGGGANGSGTVFKVTPTGEESVLYGFGSFSGDGANPFTGLVMDTEGNLYGTTSAGGKHKFGTAFKLTPSGEEKVIHSFGAGTEDGRGPNPLIIDKAGNLYGTTALGSGKCYGTVFEMTLAGKETALHHFYPDTGDGYDPQAGVVINSKGNLYGTTAAGGKAAYAYGTMFEVTP
jgi:uncharacterized repeat protein (TIGR03803 family)